MLGIRKKMGKMGRKRIIKKEEEEEKVVANEEEDETPVKVEVPKSPRTNKKDIVNQQRLEATAYELTETAVLLRNILSKPDGGFTDMEYAALGNALIAVAVASENVERFVEIRDQQLMEAKKVTEEKGETEPEE